MPELERDPIPSSPAGTVKRWRLRIKGSPSAKVVLDTSSFLPPTEWSQLINVKMQDWVHGTYSGSGLTSSPRTETVDIHEEHQKTRELISEKLSDLAQKQDVIEAKKGIIAALQSRIDQLEARLMESNAELAKSKELEACSNRLCEQVRLQSDETRELMSKEL